MPDALRSRYRELVSADLQFWYAIPYQGFHRRDWRAIDVMCLARRSISHAVKQMARIHYATGKR